VTLRRRKKSCPTSLWGHLLTVTALARSARGLDNEIILKRSQLVQYQPTEEAAEAFTGYDV